jgi:hypothetical protein
MPHAAEPVLAAGAYITIVSGIPRSGTSLMMQMLAAGGRELLIDDCRQPDENNPRGYLEFEPVKNFRQDASWLPQARGKVVKIISQFLFDLPATETYRLVLMQRDISEVLASQEAMMAGGDRRASAQGDLRSAFLAHLRKLDSWLAERENISTLRIGYAAIVAAPLELANQVNHFLGGDLNPFAMAEAIDPSLYRQHC